MGILTKLTDFVGGSLFKEIKDTVITYFPPDLSPADKANLERELQTFLATKELEANRILKESAEQLDKRIAEQEGTASDLKSIPILGPLMLFARGSQRPIWGFFTMYIDYRWFFEAHNFSEQQNTAMIVINFLVLGFLFGERAMKNLMPYVIKAFVK